MTSQATLSERPVDAQQLLLPGAEAWRPPAVESFEVRNDEVLRRVLLRGGGLAVSGVPASAGGDVADGDAAAFDRAWLRLRERPRLATTRGTFTAVDLFSGCGGLSLGVWEAGRAVGLEMRALLAVDVNAAARDVYATNFPEAVLSGDPIESLLDGQLGSPPTLKERRLQQQLGVVTLALAGPPCQGHSTSTTTREDQTRKTRSIRAPHGLPKSSGRSTW